MNPSGKSKCATANLGEIVFNHGGFVRGHSASAGALTHVTLSPRTSCKISHELAARNLILSMPPPDLGYRHSQYQAQDIASPPHPGIGCWSGNALLPGHLCQPLQALIFLSDPLELGSIGLRVGLSIGEI